MGFLGVLASPGILVLGLFMVLGTCSLDVLVLGFLGVLVLEFLGVLVLRLFFCIGCLVLSHCAGLTLGSIFLSVGRK